MAALSSQTKPTVERAHHGYGAHNFRSAVHRPRQDPQRATQRLAHVWLGVKSGRPIYFPLLHVPWAFPALGRQYARQRVNAREIDGEAPEIFGVRRAKCGEQDGLTLLDLIKTHCPEADTQPLRYGPEATEGDNRPSLRYGAPNRMSLRGKRCGRHALEPVVAMRRNKWSPSPGTCTYLTRFHFNSFVPPEAAT